jgi:hypothetical protein
MHYLLHLHLQVPFGDWAHYCCWFGKQ